MKTRKKKEKYKTRKKRSKRRRGRPKTSLVISMLASPLTSLHADNLACLPSILLDLVLAEICLLSGRLFFFLFFFFLVHAIDELKYVYALDSLKMIITIFHCKTFCMNHLQPFSIKPFLI